MGKINVKATQRHIKSVNKDLFVLNTEATYSTIPAREVMEEVAQKLNQPVEVIQMNLSAIQKIIKSHVCNGHSVEIPYLGHLRFGFTSSAVEKASDVKKSLIKSYKIVYQPCVEIKQMLKSTSINITIYDKQGNIIGTATDTGSDVEDNAGSDQTQGGDNSQQGGGTQQPSATKYVLTLKRADNSVISTTELAAGAAITYPTATSGYMWPVDAPTVMPAQATTVTEVVDDDPNVL